MSAPFDLAEAAERLQTLVDAGYPVPADYATAAYDGDPEAQLLLGAGIYALAEEAYTVAPSTLLLCDMGLGLAWLARSAWSGNERAAVLVRGAEQILSPSFAADIGWLAQQAPEDAAWRYGQSVH